MLDHRLTNYLGRAHINLGTQESKLQRRTRRLFPLMPKRQFAKQGGPLSGNLEFQEKM